MYLLKMTKIMSQCRCNGTLNPIGRLWDFGSWLQRVRKASMFSSMVYMPSTSIHCSICFKHILCSSHEIVGWKIWHCHFATGKNVLSVRVQSRCRFQTHGAKRALVAAPPIFSEEAILDLQQVHPQEPRKYPKDSKGIRKVICNVIKCT